MFINHEKNILIMFVFNLRNGIIKEGNFWEISPLFRFHRSTAAVNIDCLWWIAVSSQVPPTLSKLRVKVHSTQPHNRRNNDLKEAFK